MGEQGQLLKTGGPSANEITARILLEAPRRFPQARMWRCNTGGGYPVATVRAALAQLYKGDAQGAIATLQRARIVRFGVPGMPDIDGLCGPDGRRIGIEVKAGRDEQSEEQKACELVWRRHGAVYLLAHEDIEVTMDALAREIAGKGRGA